MRTKNYEAKLTALKKKIDNKSKELKTLKSEYDALNAEYEQNKNKELLDLLAEKGIPASKAVDILNKALSDEEEAKE